MTRKLQVATTAIAALIGAAAIVLVSTNNSTSLLWSGGYTSAFSGWNVQRPGSPQSIVSVNNPIAGTGLWAKFTIKPTDYSSATNHHSNRAQLNNFTNSNGKPGQSGYYAWSTYFDPSYNPPTVAGYPNWNIFTQFQHQGFVNQAMMNFEFGSICQCLFMAQTWGVAAHPSGTTKLWTIVPHLTRGKRYNFVFYVKWSHTVGEEQLWINGNVVIPLTKIATLYNDDTQAYFIEMIYRIVNTSTDIVYQTGARIAPSYDIAIKGFPTWP